MIRLPGGYATRPGAPAEERVFPAMVQVNPVGSTRLGGDAIEDRGEGREKPAPTMPVALIIQIFRMIFGLTIKALFLFTTARR